jgi:hypothetical protein
MVIMMNSNMGPPNIQDSNNKLAAPFRMSSYTGPSRQHVRNGERFYRTVVREHEPTTWHAITDACKQIVSHTKLS